MIQRWLRSTAAGAVLVAVVAGLPVLLVRFGRSPLDGTGSIWQQLADLPTQAISDNVAFGLLTIGAWIAWACFTLNVVAEVATTVGGPASWRAFSFGPFHTTAHRLVVALTMSASLGTSMTTRSGVVPLLPTAAAVAAPGPDIAEPAGPSARDDARALEGNRAAAEAGTATILDDLQPEAAQAAFVVTVAPGDSPWTLAERHLGDGLRWREIWEMNRGVPQPDGRAWVTEDLIRPGWGFTLPDDASGVPTSDIPQSTIPESPPLPPPDDEDAGLPDAGRETTAPSGPASSGPPVPDTTSVPPAPTPVPETPTAHPADELDAGEDDESRAPIRGLLGIAGTLLAVGMLRELRRRKARRATTLPVAAVPPPTPRTAVGKELLIQADEYAVDRLEAAIAHLATSMRARTRKDCPQPQLIQVAGSRIDVLLDRPELPPPPPWRAEASGLCWVLDGDHDLQWEDDLLPLPGLVTVGVGDADILLDLEAYGVVALTGDPDACRAMARSMATELASRTEGTVTVEVVGDLLGDISRLDGVRNPASWNTTDIGPIGTSSRLLEAGGWRHTWAARSSGQIYDGWAPHIWITAPADHPTYQQAVEAIRAHPGTGSAIVVVGEDPGCGLRVHLDDQRRFAIPDLGLRGEAQRIADAVVDQLGDLLDNADAEPPFEPQEPAPALVVAGDGDPIQWLEDQVHAPGTYADPPFDVLVRVCGPIQVEGGSGSLPARETAIATYVALNGEVDIERIRDAVWAGADVSVKRVRNVVSTVRAAVGDAIVFTPDHRLAPGDGLITDLELLRRRQAHASAVQDRHLKAHILQGAMDWVSGRVCWYPQSRRRCWIWIDLDDWIPHVESLVGTIARDLATLYLNLGDAESARRAVEQAIDAIGRRNELTVLHVRAYEALGDEAAARSVIRSHERYLDELGVDEYDEALLDLLDRYATPARQKAHR